MKAAKPLGPAFDVPIENTFDPSRPHARITLKGCECKKNDDGTWDVFVPSKEMTADQWKALENMFPNTMRQIETALHTEAILACIVS